MTYIIGIDGCKAGWISISKDLESSDLSSDTWSSIKELFENADRPDLITIDIPIGLPDTGSRQCDQLARRRLGWPKASCVFPAPIRPALYASTRKEADAITRKYSSKGVGAQAFNIYSRIQQVDEIIRSNHQSRKIIYEIHPELCFMEWNKGIPIIPAKKTYEGMTLRMNLVQAHFGKDAFTAVRSKHKHKAVADDDILDAFAALWTAERILWQEAKSIPDPPVMDSLGISMSMWY